MNCFLKETGITVKCSKSNYECENILFLLCLCLLTTSADALPGVLRWQSRLWQLVTKLRGARQLGDIPNPSLLKKKELAETKKIWENKNYAIHPQ